MVPEDRLEPWKLEEVERREERREGFKGKETRPAEEGLGSRRSHQNPDRTLKSSEGSNYSKDRRWSPKNHCASDRFSQADVNTHQQGYKYLGDHRPTNTVGQGWHGNGVLPIVRSTVVRPSCSQKSPWIKARRLSCAICSESSSARRCDGRGGGRTGKLTRLRK